MKVELNYDINKLVSSVAALKSVLETILFHAESNEERVSEMEKLRKVAVEALGENTDFLKIIKRAASEVERQAPEFVAENKINLRWNYTKDDFNTAEPYAENITEIKRTQHLIMGQIELYVSVF